MNKIELMGRTVAEIELRYGSGDEKTAIGKFRIAVPKRFKKEDQDTDFFNCTAFGKTAENLAKYFHKGDRILICGRLDENTWTDREGKKRSSVEIVVEEFDFVEAKKKEDPGDQFMALPDAGEELPFKL